MVAMISDLFLALARHQFNEMATGHRGFWPSPNVPNPAPYPRSLETQLRTRKQRDSAGPRTSIACPLVATRRTVPPRLPNSHAVQANTPSPSRQRLLRKRARSSLDICHLLRLPKDVVEHRGGQFAGEGVLLAGVVAAQQHHLAVSRAHGRGCRVSEFRLRPGHLATAGSNHVER